MPKRSSSSKKKSGRFDPIQTAARILAEATGDTSATPESPTPVDAGKNPAAVSLGRLGGLKGGKARAAKLSDEQRSAIARKAAKSRWSKKRTKS